MSTFVDMFSLLVRKSVGVNLQARGGDSTNWVGINTLKYQFTKLLYSSTIDGLAHTDLKETYDGRI